MSNVRWSANLLAVFAAAAFGLSLVLPHTSPPKYTGLADARVPEAVAGFQSQGEEEISAPVRAALSAADLVSRNYSSQNGQSIQFTMIGGTDRSALHDPRSCLVGAGWRIENDHTETIPSTGINARFCRIVQSSTKEAYEVVYLYVVNKEIVTEVTQIRLRMLLSALVGRKGVPTVFMRFMRPLQTGAEADAASRAQFLEFAAQMWKTLQPHIQQSDAPQQG